VVDQHPLPWSGLVLGNAGANFLDYTAWFMTTDEVRVVTTRHEIWPQIAAAHARGANLDDDFAVARRRIGKLAHLDLAVPEEYHPSHRR